MVTTEKYNKARNELQALKTMRDEWAKKQREWEKERQTAWPSFEDGEWTVPQEDLPGTEHDEDL